MSGELPTLIVEVELQGPACAYFIRCLTPEDKQALHDDLAHRPLMDLIYDALAELRKTLTGETA